MKKIAISLFLIVIVSAQSDGTPPEITSFSFTPDTINTSDGPDTVFATIGLKDDVSGLKTVSVYFQSPGGTNKSNYANLNGGMDTTVTIPITLPQYSEAGNWKVWFIYPKDMFGNSSYIYTDSLNTKGYETILVNDPNASVVIPISVTTKAATSITKTTAYLNGYVSTYGGTHQLYFQYGKNSSVTENEKDVGVSISAVTSSFNTGAKVEGLASLTNYSFRLISKSSSGEIQGYGNTLTFTTPSNTSPVISTINDITVNEDASGTATLDATDADGDAITYSAVSDTNAVTVSVSSSTLTLTPIANWNGVANIKAYASDGSAKDSTSFKLTVTSVNDAPTLTKIMETLSTNEEIVLKVPFKGADVDGDDLTYAYASDTSGVAATHNTAKDSLVLTPVTDFFGNAIITVTVSDGSLSDTSSFTLNVININDPPILSSIQNQTINEDEVIVVKLTATDLDGDALSYSGIADTSAVTVTASNDTLKLTPKADWNGTSVITAIALDGTTSDSTSFTLNVNPVQDVPYAFDWVSPNERDTINVDKNNTATEYVFKWNSSKDVDGDALTYHFYVADSLIEVLSDTTTAGTYQDFLDHWPLQFQMLPRMTFTFNVWVHDGTDSVKVTGEPRKVLVNRYENLSTEGEGVPIEFALHENYPNPFNPTTTLRFDLPEVSSITLTIYNMLGQKVKTFNMQSIPAGYHSVTWNATNDLGEQIGAGVYLYQLQAKNFVKTRKMVLLK